MAAGELDDLTWSEVLKALAQRPDIVLIFIGIFLVLVVAFYIMDRLGFDLSGY